MGCGVDDLLADVDEGPDDDNDEEVVEEGDLARQASDADHVPIRSRRLHDEPECRNSETEMLTRSQLVSGKNTPIS